MMGRGLGETDRWGTAETTMTYPSPNLQVMLEVSRVSRTSGQWTAGGRDDSNTDSSIFPYPHPRSLAFWASRVTPVLRILI